jgi:hypothetical protein
MALTSLFVAALAGCGDEAQDASAGGGGSTTQSASSGAGAGGGSGGAGGVPELALVHEVGRFDRSDARGPRSTWSGSSFRTRLDGTSISVELDGAADIHFQVVVDGTPTTVFVTSGGESEYPLASDLPAGEHDIEIYRRNEGYFGAAQFLAFVPGRGGALVETPSPYRRRLEFIGDSLTCGYGIEGRAPCGFTAETESAYSTYAAITARNVEAAAHLIAFSGKGVFQNFGGDQNEVMPELYLRTLTDDPAPWDFSTFVPDAVVINLGTNDFSADIEGDDFIGAYRDLITTVRGNYAAAAIFCVTWQSWGGTNQSYVESAVRESGDPNVHVVEFVTDPDDGQGCDGHTNVASNAKLGADLTAALQETLGW